jgi:hypothetical protein
MTYSRISGVSSKSIVAETRLSETSAKKLEDLETQSTRKIEHLKSLKTNGDLDETVAKLLAQVVLQEYNAQKAAILPGDITLINGCLPLDLDRVTHQLKIKYDELVSQKKVSPMGRKDTTNYFNGIKSTNMNDSGGSTHPPAGDRRRRYNKGDKKPDHSRNKENQGDSSDNKDHSRGNRSGRRCYLCDSTEHGFLSCPAREKAKEYRPFAAKSEEAKETKPGGNNNGGGRRNPKQERGGGAKKAGVGFSGVVDGITLNVGGLQSNKIDPLLFLDDLGSNSDIVYDESLLIDVQPLDTVLSGVGTTKVTGIGVFVGKSINRDGSEVHITRRRVLVCPDFNRNIIGTVLLQRKPEVSFYRDEDPCMVAQVGEDMYRYDLHDNDSDESDPFFYFKLMPLDEDEITDAHKTIIDEAVEANIREIRSYRSQVYQTALKTAKKGILTSGSKTQKEKKKVRFIPEPVATPAVEEEINRTVKRISHAHIKRAIANNVATGARPTVLQDVMLRSAIDDTTTVEELEDEATDTESTEDYSDVDDEVVDHH